VTNINKNTMFFLFIHCTFQQLHKRLKMTLNTSFTSATVTYHIEVLTQLQEKETKEPFMVHWHRRIGILISFPTEIAPFFIQPQSLGETNWLCIADTKRALSSRFFISVYERHIIYTRDNIRICKLRWVLLLHKCKNVW